MKVEITKHDYNTWKKIYIRYNSILCTFPDSLKHDTTMTFSFPQNLQLLQNSTFSVFCHFSQNLEFSLFHANLKMTGPFLAYGI